MTTTSQLLAAFDTSRQPVADPAALARAFEAEELIARMDDGAWNHLQRQLEANPRSGLIWFWTALALEHRREHARACQHFAQALECNFTHWRVGWYMARAARRNGDLALVDSACAAVIKAEPEFWFAREFPKHARGFYSQLGQDQIIEEFFSHNPARSRRFVEVGAFDGVHYSNVRRLHERHGWSGLCIEPVGKNFRKLAASYQGTSVQCVQAAVSSSDGQLDIHVSHYPHLPDWGSDVASIGGADQERWTRKYGAQWTKETVPSRRLTRLLDDAGIPDFDLLSIDAEGHDFEVLASLDFNRFQPQLIIVEFGSRKGDILRLLEANGYQVIRDNGQDFIARHLAPKTASSSPVRAATSPSPARTPAPGTVPPEALPALLGKLNPHLLALRTLPLDRDVRRVDLEPSRLLAPDRFDLAAKLLYARHRRLGVEAIWATEVYREHVSAFSNGTFREGDGVKNGFQDYLNAFHQLLDSVGSSGFDPALSIVPVDRQLIPIDGAHRVASALAFNASLPALVFDFQAKRYDWRFFRDRGLPEAVRDAMALEFARTRTDAFFLHLFPTAEGRDEEVRAILREFGAIVYEKALSLQGEGPALLVRELYSSEAWIGTWANQFAGARKDASIRFDGGDPLRLFLFLCDDPARAREAKNRIRQLYGLGNYSCHVNDTHEETVRLAQLYFNANSIHFLNHARPRYLQRFHQHLEMYRKWLQSTGADPEQFCIDGSASLAAYGLRDAQDLDVLHLNPADFSPVMPGVNSHNAHVHHHVVSRDQIVFHPEHHFSYAGLKFVSLPTLRAMKVRRAEGKDLADVALIDSLTSSPAPRPSPSVDVSAKDAPREALRIYYVPNGDDFHIAALLDRLYATVKPFGCRDVQDYIDRRILAYKTPDAGRQLWDEVRAMRPDLVYVESARNLEPDLLHRIRTELEIPVTMWFGDACVNDEFIERILSYSPSVTHQVTVDRHVALAARKRDLSNVEFIPFFGYDHYFKPLDGPKTIEILFSGKSYHRSLKRYPFAADRLAFVQRVNREFGSRLHVVGEDWESFGLANARHTRVPEWEVNQLNNASRIVLAYDAAHVDGFTSCRTYHALLGRSFILLRKFPGAERLFVNREHLVWFETEQEGIDLLNHYLARPDECDRIARAGYQHVRANGWMFSNVVRHLVHRGLGRHSQSFEEVHAPYSKPLPQSGSQAKPAASRTPKDPKASRRRPASAVDDCLRQADRFFQEGKLAEARQWLERVLDLDPSSPDVWTASGNIALQLGDPAAAVRALTKASELRPQHAPTLVSLAAAHIQAGHIPEFEETLAAAFSIDPAEPSAVRLLADLNLANGRYTDAAQGFYQLIQRQPSDVPSLLALGFCFAKTGDADTARETFREVLRHDPSNAVARENLQALGVQPPPVAVAPTSPTPPSNESRPPLVTAIVSTYKSERFMRGCLQDLLNQTIADRLEIIVIDSGSPENERAIVEEFQQRHPRIRYVRTERETIYAAWNRGVQLASAPFLTSANTDDRHRPDALERLVAALEASPRHAVAYADCAVCENVHPDFGFAELRGYYRWPDFEPVLLFRACYVGPQPVWRRSLHQRHGLFDPSYKSAGDYEFWLRLARTEQFLHLPEVLGLHWYAESSLGHQSRDLTREESDRARVSHWPAEWGSRPTEKFRTLHLLPSIEAQRRRVEELTAQVKALELEKLQRESAPAPARSSPGAIQPKGPQSSPEPKLTLSHLPNGHSTPTVPAVDILPSDFNPDAFQHLLHGFDLVRENRFEDAQEACDRYRDLVNYDSLPRTDLRADSLPAVSVIIVAHQTRQALLLCLDSLLSHDNPPHEIIVVDNGGNESIEAELHRRPLLHIRTPVNVLPSEARNIGIHFARAALAVFVDDDATVAPGFLASILDGFQAFDVVGFRGRVRPHSSSGTSPSARHYDLGDRPLVADLNTEGNCAIQVAVWRHFRGQDPLLFGGEGVELSYRITRELGEASLAYWPGAVIHHDYAFDESKRDRKSDRHRAARQYLDWKHPDLLEYHDRLKLAPRSEDEILQRTRPLRSRSGSGSGTATPIAVPASSTPAPAPVPVADPIGLLTSSLAQRGWSSKLAAYAQKLKRIVHVRHVPEPSISVVIIAHEIRVDSVTVLRKLQEERDGRFEVVYVLNGTRAIESDQILPFVDTVVELTENTGAYFARNVGSAFARAPLLFFLDDDAIPQPGCVAAHLEEFRRFEIIAVRGAIVPKTANPLNELARHYHLGEHRFPIQADIEGNTSYLAKAFYAVGGWDDDIVFGGGGIDLAFRLLAFDSDRRKQIYSPVPVVHHDYAASEEHLARKRSKQEESRQRLYRKHPQFEALRNGWRSFFRRENLVIPKAQEPRPNSPPPNRSLPSGATPHPLITVAIPTYNRARFLREAVQSALDQTYPNLEIVIVDDGSTDGTDSILRSLTDPRIRFFSKKHSGGPDTRNRCIGEARGEFIVWLDSDDVLLADTLSLYVAELGRFPDLDVIYGNLLVADEHLRVQEVWTYDDYHGWPEALLAESTIDNRIPNGGTLVRRSCYERFGLYDTEFPRAHDYEFWTRLAPSAVVKSILTEVAIYRRHEDSLTKVSKPNDSRHEAHAIRNLVGRHPLQVLLPFCYPAGISASTGDARALSILSILMARHGDLPAAITYGRQSVQAANLGRNAELLDILEVMAGSPRQPRRDRAQSADEFTQLVEAAKRHFLADQIQPCAKACARLSEIRPEALETLLLTAMSLRRWGGHLDARTAFQCLVRLLCRTSYADATSEAEKVFLGRSDSSCPTLAPVPSSIDARNQRLALRLAPFFGQEPIPSQAVATTLDFIEKAAATSDPASFLNVHLHGQTPLFFALLGLTPDEVSRDADAALADTLSRVRAAMQPAPDASRRFKPGYSFCIITGGQRPEKVRRQIASIRALGLPDYEIIVGGEVSQVPDDVRKFDLAGAAKAGRLGKMRNALCRAACFDHLVVSDDDMLFDPGFADGLRRFGEAYNLMSVRIVNPDGSRFWDWAASGGLKGSSLIEYWESDPHIYVTGGFCILKAAAFAQVQWDENLGFYEAEDVDFSTRAKAAGFPISFNAFCIVHHDDDRYSRVGRAIFRFDHLLGELVQKKGAQSPDEVQFLLATARRMAGSLPDRIAEVRRVAALLGIHFDSIPSLASLPRHESPSAQPLLPTPPSIGERSRSVRSDSPVGHRNIQPVDSTHSCPPSSAASEPSRAASSPRPASPGKIGIDWIGSYLDHGSLSHVNREFTQALAASRSVNLRRVTESAPAGGSLPRDWKRLASSVATTPSRQPALTVRHAWPPRWERPASGALVVIQPWEFGHLPESWVRDLQNVDEVWVPSRYVQQVYRDSGVPAEKVAVIPNGVNPDRFHPGVPPTSLATRKRFKFLFVGGTIFRKGPDLLLKAYLARFTAADDVCLVIKDFGGKDVYAGQTFEATIRAAQATPNAPEILYLNQEWSPDSIPGLYTACDALILPYRGEGFALPALEAMACGLPVVVTAGGATDDFATDDLAYRIPAVRKEFGTSISGMPLVRPGWLLEPDLAALQDRMTWIFQHPDEAKARGLAASAHVHEHWTWENAARLALERARLLTNVGSPNPASSKAPLPNSPRSAPSPKPLQLPDCARVGHLGPARELLKLKKLREAWQSCLLALQHRPFHPEAFLLLAEIANQAGDSVSARQCAQHAQNLAPDWKPAKTFLKTNPRGNSRPAWLQLPPALDKGDAAPGPRISVCLIVKNEEQFIGQCLGSIRDLAHQIVVVDTGSTDRTIEIARHFGAQIHSFTWCDDFSAARNAALTHATGDWVLMLDADEELPADQHPRLASDLRKSRVLGFRVPLVNVGSEAEGVAYVPRLYRNAPGLFYVSRIHEQVFSSILVRAEEWGLETALGTSQLRHYGYSKELVRDRKKAERNLRLLRQAIEEIPDDANLLMNLALEFSHAGDKDAALAEYDRAFQVLCLSPDQQRAPELRETLLTQYTSALMQARRYSDIVRVLQSPLAKAHELTASLHFALGLAHLRSERPDDAAQQMRQCVAKRHLPTFSPVNPEIHKAGPYHCLGLCLSSRGLPEEAETAFRAALRDEPTSRAVRMDYARLLRAQQRHVDAIKMLHELVAVGRADVEVWRLGGEIALSQPALLEFAVDWTGEAAKALPTQPILAGLHGEARLLSGDPSGALPFLKASASAGDTSHRAAQCLCELAAGTRVVPVPQDLESATSTHFIRWYQRLVASPQNHKSLLQVNEQLHILDRTLPSAARSLRAAILESA